jgi:hypothetical protein
MDSPMKKKYISRGLIALAWICLLVGSILIFTLIKDLERMKSKFRASPYLAADPEADQEAARKKAIQSFSLFCVCSIIFALMGMNPFQANLVAYEVVYR